MQLAMEKGAKIKQTNKQMNSFPKYISAAIRPRQLICMLLKSSHLIYIHEKIIAIVYRQHLSSPPSILSSSLVVLFEVQRYR